METTNRYGNIIFVRSDASARIDASAFDLKKSGTIKRESMIPRTVTIAVRNETRVSVEEMNICVSACFSLEFSSSR